MDKTDKSKSAVSLVGDLAQSVIGQLVEAPMEVRQKRLEDVSQQLYQMSLRQKPHCTRTLRADLVEQRILSKDLHDRCIGEAARILGDDWVNDRLSFAEVARASSWLFGLCKEVGEEWSNTRMAADGQAILVATLEGESHLIGAATIAQKMRREGNSVFLSCNARPSELANRLNTGDFDCLMVSVGSQVGLENVSQAVRTIRQGSYKYLPIVLGGAVLELCECTAAEIGVDLVTNDENTAVNALRESLSAPCAGAAE